MMQREIAEAEVTGAQHKSAVSKYDQWHYCNCKLNNRNQSNEEWPPIAELHFLSHKSAPTNGFIAFAGAD